MTENASNWCFVSEPTIFYLESKYLVLIDPLVLDGLAEKLADLPDQQSTNPKESIAPLSRPNYPMRIGLHEIDDFQPGHYQLGLNDFIAVDPDEADSEVVDVDSGTIIAIDFTYLASLAKVLTWEQYDLALQSPIGDNSAFIEINNEVGGPFYAVLSGEISYSFRGDGSYKLKIGKPILLDN